MAVIRTRESVSEMPSSDYLEAKKRDGWSLSALVWQREVPDDRLPADPFPHEVPYGLRVAGNGEELEQNPDEMETLTVLLDLIVSERSLGQVVEELDRQGFRNREGESWTQTEVFQLLPRLIEDTPHIFDSADWAAKVHNHGPAPA